MLAIPVPDHKGTDGKTVDSGYAQTDAGGLKSDLERKLESVLGAAKGVGSVQVLLMTGGQETSAGLAAREEENEIKGILVVAQGADDPVTVQNIQQAVMALFQVEAHKIKIMKMK